MTAMTQGVIFLGTRQVGRRCLEILLAQRAALGLEVVEVVTKRPANAYLARNADLAAVASAAGIPVAEDLAPSGSPVEFILSVQHERVLSPDQLARVTRLAVNLHMAPLPEYRGAGQVSFAILNNESEFGTTLHLMEARVDAGGILAQRRFAIAADWTVQDLYEKTVEESVMMFTENLAPMMRGELRPRLQSEFQSGRPLRFYRRSDLPAHKQLNLQWPLERIDRTVRAFDMPGYEPAYVMFGNRRLYVRTRDLLAG